MPSVTTLLAASAIASLAIANPLPAASKKSKQGFTVHESVAIPLTPGPIALAKVYAKYSVAVPDNVAVVAAALADGSVTATPEQFDSEYLCPVTIGGQTLNLDFDTGSADLWVFSSELPSSEQSGHSVYNPSKSSTSKVLSGYSWSINYGDGSSASGNVYTDTVNVGGTTVTGQAIELAEQISAQFQQDTDSDGLLGLAFSVDNTVTPKAQNTFFQTAINEGVLQSNLFTVNLKKGAPGSYDFGFIDASKHTGSITYAAVDKSQGFWEFTSSGYQVDSGSFVSTSIDAIADTGTSLLLLDDNIVSAYYAKVSGASYDDNQGGYTFPCSASLPTFSLGIGSYHAQIPGSYMNYAQVSSSTCYGGLQSNDGIGFSIFGDIFLKAVFAVFDSTNTRIGFAPKTLTS